MYIHTVKAGETLGEIAKLYDTTEERLKENNLICGELCEGRELLILTPTRTHIRKAGESLEKIAKRFAVKTEDLILNNPSLSSLSEKEACELAIKYGTPPYGAIAVNGYCYRGMRAERLKAFLPFLTYLTVSAYRIGSGGVERIFNDRDILRLAREKGKLAFMRVRDGSDGKRYQETEYRRAIIRSVTDISKSAGYCGAVLSCSGLRLKVNEVREFIRELWQDLGKMGLKLFLETDEETDGDFYDLCDGCIFIYDKAYLKEAPSFENGEKAVLKKLSDQAESSKVFIDLPSVGFDEKMNALPQEAIFALGKNCTVTQDEGTLISEWHTASGRGRFTPLKNIKSRLDLVYALGFGGVSIDLGSVTREYLMLIGASFSPIRFY